MIVSNCPRCAESFRIPTAGLPDDAYAECPWCRESFPLAEVLHRLPPMLRVISADGEPLPANEWSEVRQDAFAGGHAAGFVTDRSPSGGPQDDGGAATTVSDLSPDEFEHKTVAEDTVAETIDDAIDGSDHMSASQFDLEDPHDTWEGNQAAERSSTPAPMRVTPAPVRHRKSSGSPIRTMLSVVLGGLAAGPLAVLILWVLTLFGVNVDLGFWPLDGSSAVVGTNPVAAEPAELPDVRTGSPSSTPDEDRSLNRDDGFDFSTESDAFDPVAEDTGGDEIDVFADPADQAASEFRASFEEGDELENAAEPSTDAAKTTGALPESPDLEFAESDSPDAGIPADVETTAEPTASSDSEDGTPGDPFAGDDPFDIDSDPFDTDSDPFDVDSDPFDVDAEPNEQADSPSIATADVSAAAADEPGLRINEANDAETAVEPNADRRIAADPENTAGSKNAATPENVAGTDLGTEPDRSVEADSENVTGKESDSEPAAPKPATSVARSPQGDAVDPTPDAVAEAVESAFAKLEALEAVDRSDSDQFKRALAEAYVATARVGELAEESSSAIGELMEKIRQSKDMATWEIAGPDWITRGTEKRWNEGVLLVGAPQIDEKPASLLLSTGASIRLSDDSVSLPDAERVIGLGKIIASDPEPVIKFIVAEPL